MKLTTIVLSSVLMLGSTLAPAQGASSGDATAAGGATGAPAGAGSSSAVKSDKMDPRGTRDSAQGSGSATPRPLPPVTGPADRLGLVLPMQLRATPQAHQKAPRPANNEAGLRARHPDSDWLMGVHRWRRCRDRAAGALLPTFHNAPRTLLAHLATSERSSPSTMAEDVNQLHVNRQS